MIKVFDNIYYGDDDPNFFIDFMRHVYPYQSVHYSMQCLNPYRVDCPGGTKYSRKIKYVDVPCGKCYNCIINNRSQWAFRLFQEACYSQSNYFITLTYEDKYLHIEKGKPVLEKKFMSKWLKNLVQYCRDKYNVTVKYYLCGEYGWASGRPHYHFHLFNLPDDIDIYDFIKSKWSKGNFYIGSTEPGSAMYTTKHNLLKLLPTEFNPNHDVEDIVPPFRLMSKGIGKDYYHVLVDVQKSDSCTSYFAYVPSHLDYNGVSIPVPRYYREMLDRYIPYSVIHQYKEYQHFNNSRSSYQKESDAITKSKILQNLPMYKDKLMCLGFSTYEELETHCKQLDLLALKNFLSVADYTFDRLLETFEHNTKV